MPCYPSSVTLEERAEHRRRTWQGGRVEPGELAELDRSFWLAATPEERLSAVWEMAQQAWMIEHPNGPPLRLDRSVGGIRRGTG